MLPVSHYLYEYVKFNNMTTVFLVAVGSVFAFKLIPFRWPLSKWKTFALILVFGLILRLWWLGYSAHTPMSHWNATHMLETDRINVHAIELSQEGKWFLNPDGTPSGRRPIGYPILLALFYKLFGVSLMVAWALNLMLYALTVFLLFELAEKIFGEKIALITSFLFAIYPMSIYSIKLLTDEHLFLPLFYLGIFILFMIVKGQNVKFDWFWLGIVFGYATMTRTHSIFTPFVVGITYWVLKRPWKEAILKFILMILVMQAINLPWVIRNYKAWKVPVLYTATTFFVYGAVNSTAVPEGDGHAPYKGEPGYSPELDAAAKLGNEGLEHQIAGREMKKWILTHPMQFLNLGIKRLLVFMCFNRKSGIWAIWHQYYPGSYDPSRPLPETSRKFLEECAFAFYYTAFFTWLFTNIFLIFHWNQLPIATQRCLIVLNSCFLFWFMEHMIIFPDRKYRFPLEPLMLISTAFFFYRLPSPRSLIYFFQKIDKSNSEQKLVC